MTRLIGRRAAFFLLLAVVSAALVPATPGDLQWSVWATAGLALFWSVLLAIEHVTTHPRHHPEGQGTVPPGEGSPFDPPPFGGG